MEEVGKKSHNYLKLHLILTSELEKKNSQCKIDTAVQSVYGSEGFEECMLKFVAMDGRTKKGHSVYDKKMSLAKTPNKLWEIMNLVSMQCGKQETKGV